MEPHFIASFLCGRLFNFFVKPRLLTVANCYRSLKPMGKHRVNILISINLKFSSPLTSICFFVKEMVPKTFYLGMPVFWGKSKARVLNFVVERVRNNLQGWKNSLLSTAGKEILIKFVAMAFPSYFLSCVSFRLKI